MKKKSKKNDLTAWGCLKVEKGQKKVQKRPNLDA